MKAFQKISFDITQFGVELQEFKRLLNSSQDLSEHKQLLPLFRNRPQICTWLGMLHPEIDIPDLIAYEYDLFGDFTCDFVIGDSNKRAFCFVEFEDAKPTSIFKKRTRANSEWSCRFEHGFSQLVDWFYKLHDVEKGDDFEKRFGARSIDFMGALIIGRSSYLTLDERLRLEWREKFVLVNSQRIRCLTFDDLLSNMERWLQAFSVAIKVEPQLH